MKLTFFFILFTSLNVVGQNSCGMIIGKPSEGEPSFYKKCVYANGIPILGSEKVSDDAFCIAYDIVKHMTDSLTENQIATFLANKGKVAIMSPDEKSTDIPEHADLYRIWPGTNWNNYRGLGGTMARPVTSCAEENLLCLSGDKYKGENILVHEFAHGLQNLALYPTDNQLEFIIGKIYRAAKDKGLWQKTYAGSNQIEYFAEAVQCWFNTNRQASPANGVHNEINTREELKNYDFAIYELLANYFPDTNWSPSCDPKTVLYSE